ncbi:SIT4 phosphatase-associated family protein isoform 3 [Anopheles sinensis]|uniref:SIT4 phosphatase-associated family protein isoform 3 n=1 Tax=Anopheles sinensis TaxID=74873 RepID=A0A084VVW6_ANOSI|nr:SIT4 phosphatase-associated family protein isoform 3 [Anopheles sinensis]
MMAGFGLVLYLNFALARVRSVDFAELVCFPLAQPSVRVHKLRANCPENLWPSESSCLGRLGKRRYRIRVADPLLTGHRRRCSIRLKGFIETDELKSSPPEGKNPARKLHTNRSTNTMHTREPCPCAPETLAYVRWLDTITSTNSAGPCLGQGFTAQPRQHRTSGRRNWKGFQHEAPLSVDTGSLYGRLTSTPNTGSEPTRTSEPIRSRSEPGLPVRSAARRSHMM